jgi:hypothetical protein
MRSEATVNIYCPCCKISYPRETNQATRPGATCYVCGSRLPRELWAAASASDANSGGSSDSRPQALAAGAQGWQSFTR